MLIEIVMFVFILVLIQWLSGFIFGAAFQSTGDKELKKIIEFANPKKSDKIVDIGSGTGKIVIEFAKRGIESHGYEINPLLVWISRRKINRLNLEKRAFVHLSNFWNKDFGRFDIVILFQIGYIMRRLEKKFNNELKPGTKVISNTWKFPNKKPKRKSGKTYLYEF